jgi:dihydropyrimidinase
MGLLIKGGEVITASERYRGDVYCEGETIRRIATSIDDVPPGTEVVEAKGKYVFPGFIDPHTHVYLPFMGTFCKDDYTTGSKAALVGGTTTFIDFVIPGKSEEPLKALSTWQNASEGKAVCDYTFHLAVSRYDSQVESQIREIVNGGMPSFKIFLAYKGAFGVNDEELYGTLKLAQELGVLTMSHCENEVIIAELQQQMIRTGKTEPKWHYHTRPPEVEAEGTRHLMTFAEFTGAPVYVAHLSCKEALEQAQRARRNGVRVYVESVIPHLLLDKTYAERPGFEGAKYVMSPPLRHKCNHKVLWNGLRDGQVNTVATDHAPFDFKTQKTMGQHDFSKIPNGIPAIEDRVNLLYTYGVCEGRIDLHLFVDAASTQAAKLFGLFPRKGTIQVGADADLVVYDPSYEGKLSVKTQTMNVDYNAFEGWTIKGRPETVTVRGEVAVRGGKFVGKVGRGRFIKRDPSH